MYEGGEGRQEKDRGNEVHVGVKCHHLFRLSLSIYYMNHPKDSIKVSWLVQGIIILISRDLQGLVATYIRCLPIYLPTTTHPKDSIKVSWLVQGIIVLISTDLQGLLVATYIHCLPTYLLLLTLKTASKSVGWFRASSFSSRRTSRVL